MHIRKPGALLLALALALATATAAAQDVDDLGPRSGDPWIDARLADINDYGRRYRDPFIDEMVRYRDAPRELVTELLVERQWAPADVYYACSVARVIGRPCRYVAGEWERDRTDGWGALAQRLGIEPGSEEAARLKRGFVRSYERWARPLQLDDELRRAFPDHGKPREAADEETAAAGDGS